MSNLSARAAMLWYLQSIPSCSNVKQPTGLEWRRCDIDTATHLRHSEVFAVALFGSGGTSVVHRVIVGVTAALFLIIRFSHPETPLAIGPSGVAGWLVFGCQLAAWMILALQRATWYHDLLTRKAPVGRASSPAARLLELSITGTFGLLLWATMFAPWLFFGPLLVLHWWLMQRRAATTIYRYGRPAARGAGATQRASRWADGTPIEENELARLGILRGSSTTTLVLAVSWIVAVVLSTLSPQIQSMGAGIAAVVMVGLIGTQYGHMAATRQAG